MDTHTEHSQVEQVTPSCEENYETFEIDHERMPYFENVSTFEGEEDLGEGCSPRDEFDEDLWIGDNFYDTPKCLEIYLLPI